MKKVKKTRSLVAKILVGVIALLAGMLVIFNMIGVFVLGDIDGKIEVYRLVYLMRLQQPRQHARSAKANNE